MSITCPKCNQVVESTDGFCESCGFKINDVNSGGGSGGADSLTPQKQQQQEEQQPSPQSPSSSLSSSDNIRKVCKNKLCTNYNVEYGIDENYCGICGSELVVLSSTLEEAEPSDLQKKKGFLLMPDGTQIEITPTQRLIGRIDLSKYISEDDINQISRGHFTVLKEGDKYYVQDGKTIVQEKPSKNKTWLISGGQKEEITEKGMRELKDGDEINIADMLTLLFTLK